MNEPVPVRIQRRRSRGYDMQADSLSRNGLIARYVGRGSRWGNPYRMGMRYWDSRRRDWDTVNSIADVRHLTTEWVEWASKYSPDWLAPLRGKNLACYCPENAEWCHADTLLELANREENLE